MSTFELSPKRAPVEMFSTVNNVSKTTDLINEYD